MSVLAETTVSAIGGRRAQILGYLLTHPEQTAHQVRIGLGYRGKAADAAVLQLLKQMQAAGQVAAADSGRLCGGHPVRVWSAAPPGTPAPGRSLLTAGQLRRKRARDREQKRRSRARAKGAVYQPPAAWSLPAPAACAGEDLALFFPEPGQDDSAAKAICARCPARAACLAGALDRGEPWGIWGGFNLETDHQAAIKAAAGQNVPAGVWGPGRPDPNPPGERTQP